MIRYKILIVEDDILLAYGMQLELEQAGYEITACARNPQEAKSSITTNPPDIAILDYELSGNSKGTEVAKFIQENFPIPVIYLSAYFDNKTNQEINTTKFMMYLKKPHDTNTLLSNIRSTILWFQELDISQKKKKYIFKTTIDGSEISTSMDDILWINTVPNTRGVFITTYEREMRYRTYNTSIKKINEERQCPALVKISQSHIINLDKVSRIEHKRDFYIKNHIPNLILNRKKSPLNFIKNNKDYDWKFSLGKKHQIHKESIYQKWLIRQNFQNIHL